GRIRRCAGVCSQGRRSSRSGWSSSSRNRCVETVSPSRPDERVIPMTIKRTKFKLLPDQLLEMFYWLKLIRAFDERLSVLVRQGRVRSGVYTGIGQEAIIVGTCFGLRNDDFIAPLHRDLGSFLMK